MDDEAYDPTVLLSEEVFWRDHQKWLLDCGYILRARYQPNWKPSWIEKGTPDYLCEDALSLPRARIISDATRASDNTKVTLKIVKPSVHPHEADIGTFLSSEALLADARNHCVPIYEVLKVPDEDDKIILVMPMLREWDEPLFETVGEGVDFFSQLFEAVQFMHMHHVAHRDISELNIMMDGSMYPEGWHFVQSTKTPDDMMKYAKYHSRTERPPKYYLTDFGISRRYNPKDGPPREHPILGGDKTVPEFQKPTGLLDPFPTDIYYVGNFLRESILQEYRGFGFMKSLVKDMVQDNPDKRPTIDQVVERFGKIRGKLSAVRLHSRAGHREEWFGRVRDLSHIFTSVRLAIQKVPAIPTR